MKFRISDKHAAIAGLATAFIAIALISGFTGVRTVAGMIIFFFLPFYLLLGRLNLETHERMFFAFFMGLGLFSTIVFYAGRVIPSYRISTAAVFLALILIAFLIRRIK